MNRCLNFNAGTACRDDNEYSVNAQGTNVESTKWEGPGEETVKFGEK